ncbi:MAG: hypothetical protein P8008_00935, partial [Gammaproteobacteria bacterium]
MTSGHRSLSDFFKEVWRRRVLQVAIPYGVGGWLLVQVAEIVLDAFEAPPWIMQGILTVLVLGFPVAVVLAWVFDYTPRTGLTVTPARDDAETAVERLTAPEPEPEPEPAPALAVDIGGSERRQVTVLQCAFEATGQEDPEVDPERLRESMNVIQSFCRDLAERFGAEVMPAGSGELTLLFGYPQARDDDARRAVAAGLAIVDELQAARARELSADAVSLSARVGVATGLVVVAEPEREGDPVSVVGQAPRLSSWLVGQAAPDAVVVG